jgi:RHS repeat-associated protein
MNRLLLLALILANWAHASPEAINYNAITNFEGEPSTYVHHVDITTGNYCESIVDLVVPGVEPLVVQRYYSSANVRSIVSENGICGGMWFTNYGGKLATFPSNDDHVKKVYLKEPNGNVCHFQGKVDYQLSCYKMHIDPASYKHGHTNCGKGLISGRTNIKNIRALYDTPADELDMRVYSKVIYGSGKVREFVDNREMKIALPNGNSIVFEYDDKHKLKKVKSLNSKGKRIASLNYPATEFNNKKYNEYEVTTHDNRFVKYRSKRSDRGYLLEEVTSSDFPKVKYKWDEWSNGAVIKKIEYPDDRYVEIEYTGSHSSMVKKIYEPIGTDHRPVVAYRFEYDTSVKDKTLVDVKDAESNLTKYECQLGRVQSITRFHGSTQILNQEKLYWGAPDTPEHTNLLTRVVQDSQNHHLLCRHLKYDGNGNVIKEYLYGNLTGKNPEKCVLVDDKGQVKSNGSDCYHKEFTYSNDGFNLLLSEKDNRSTITYSYYPKTDLIKSKLIWNHNQIAIRYFYEYDANGVLICEIKDNGCSDNEKDLSGVSERHIRRVKVRTEHAPIGAPDEIELKYLDIATGYERLLHRTINDYTPQGRLKEQHHYDAENVYLYSLYWEYDSMGNVIREVNPLGQATYKRYDPNGNLVFEQGPRGDSHREYTYDYSNRLIAKVDVLADGTRLAEHYKYNYLNQKVAVSDIYGNETAFSYDPLGHVIATTLPMSITDSGNSTQIVLKATYDALGNPITSTDGRGFVTESLHTARGKPYSIHYPDGTCEKNEYSIDGLLVKNVNPHGLTTKYQYDYQGRLIKQECLSEAGELLSKHTYLYNAFHLESETDPNGVTTTYHYDAAGRLMRVKKGMCCTVTDYDSCGRISRTQIYDAVKTDNSIATVFKYDLLNRVIEEDIEDALGNLQRKTEYAYDEMGNRTQTIAYGESGKAITQAEFNPLGQVVKTIDPEGNTTIIRYDYKFFDAQGQHVAFREITDPAGNITQEIHDTLGRVSQIIRKNRFGKVTQKQLVKYDKNGNRKMVEHTVSGPNVLERLVATSWSYDTNNRVTQIVDASGTPDQKQTTFKYNEKGQRETIVKPNGTKIKHAYDGMGRLRDLSSSDNTIHYVYHYDLKGNCVRVEDLVNQSSTTRVYDQLDHIIQETLDTGITLKFEWDALGRPVNMVLPDSSAVSYDYEGSRLKEISRYNAKGVLQYQHTYRDYDLSGQVIQSQLAGDAGSLSTRYDLCGRVKSIQHSAWSEEIPEGGYDKAGNLLKTVTRDSVGDLNHQFSYDDLYQIKTEKGAVQHQYVYDSLYNRLEKDNQKTKLNHLNQILTDSDNNYSYDANGNLIQVKNADGAVKLGYDALDRLTSVQTDKVKMTYRYDAFNRRIAKTKKNQTDLYLYAGENECGCMGMDGTVKEFRVLGIGKGAEIGAAVAIELKKEIYVPIHNHLGSVAALLRMDGSVAETYRYTAFGEESIFDGAGQKQSISLNPWRFASKRVDGETGFVFFGRRCYDPCAGRWMTRDPKGYDAGPNLYAYVMNNPLVRWDLYGLDWVQEGDTWVMRRSEHDRSSSAHYRSQREIASSERYRESRAKRDDFYGSSVQRIGNSEGNKYAAIVSNGVTTSSDTILARAKATSEALNGAETSAFHIFDHGLIMDLIHNTLVRVGFCTPAVHNYANKVRSDIALKIIQGNRDPVILLKGHSNAGRIMYQALKHLSPAEKSHLEIATYGTACLIPNGEFKSVTNYITKGDVITLLGNPVGYARSIIDPGYANIEYVDSNTSIFDRHNFESNYSDIDREVNYQFIQKYGGF